jgi:thymidylate kinase
MAGAPRGAFILFEGVDRSGKSTQAARLVETLKSQGVSRAAAGRAPPHAARAADRARARSPPSAAGHWLGVVVPVSRRAPLNPAAAQTPAELWRFPDRKGTVTGKAIDEYLSAPAPAAAGANAGNGGANATGAAGLSDQAIHLLFSANRWEKR